MRQFTQLAKLVKSISTEANRASDIVNKDVKAMRAIVQQEQLARLERMELEPLALPAPVQQAFLRLARCDELLLEIGMTALEIKRIALGAQQSAAKPASATKSAARSKAGKKAAATRKRNKAAKQQPEQTERTLATAKKEQPRQRSSRAQGGGMSYAEQAKIVRSWAPQYFKPDREVVYPRTKLAAQLQVQPHVMTDTLKKMCAEDLLKHNGKIRTSSYLLVPPAAAAAAEGSRRARRANGHARV